MSRFSYVAILSATVAYFGFSTLPCLAQASQQDGSSAMPSTVQPYTVKVNMKPMQMAMLAKIMHSGHSYCFLQDLDPLDDSSMVLTCLPGRPPTVSFSP